MTLTEKNNSKTIKGWCMYDWANSVYSLTITTAVFPSYFYGVTGGKNAVVEIFGMQVTNTVLYSYTLSAAFLVVALLNPALSSIADSGGYKKGFLKAFCYLGAFSCAALYFFDSESILTGVVFFALASIGWGGSLVFYNSFLPEIATEDKFDKISARGYAYGYVGSVLLLIFNLLMIQKKEWFGIPPENNIIAPKISFLTVGLWWFLFAQITFSRLPSNIYGKSVTGSIIKKGFLELKLVWSQVKEIVLLKKFLMAFFFYSMGVQTVMYLATIFGEEVVKMEIGQLILMVLILNIVAIPGAYFFAKLSESYGNITSLLVAVGIWIVICGSAFFVGEGDLLEFYIIGAFVGIVMGGIQATSRATYSKLIPEDTTDHASYFSFYETLEKISIALGTFVFGLVRYLTGNMNTSALVLALFFLAGFLILLTIPSRKLYDIRLNNSVEKNNLPV